MECKLLALFLFFLIPFCLCGQSKSQDPLPQEPAQAARRAKMAFAALEAGHTYPDAENCNRCERRQYVDAD